MDRKAMIREGVSAGLIGATVIALWFGIIDAIAGSMFATPIMLGSAVGTLFMEGAVPSTAGAFLMYTVLHYAMFVLIGIVFSWVLHSAEKTPSALIGFIGLFVAFEVWWIGWTTVLAEGFGQLAWYQVFMANLIAAGTMGYYMYRQHPALPGKVRKILVTAE